MDAQSLSSFTDMANCVVNEYSNFCPLNASVYGQGACIDGAQTQGENIADNGGIHAAFRAYKNYINLNGPDPLLPDGMLQGFTADQLFFLGFAQVPVFRSLSNFSPRSGVNSLLLMLLWQDKSWWTLTRHPCTEYGAPYKTSRPSKTPSTAPSPTTPPRNTVMSGPATSAPATDCHKRIPTR